jgi:hypothetical protein
MLVPEDAGCHGISHGHFDLDDTSAVVYTGRYRWTLQDKAAFLCPLGTGTQWKERTTSLRLNIWRASSVNDLVFWRISIRHRITEATDFESFLGSKVLLKGGKIKDQTFVLVY